MIDKLKEILEKGIEDVNKAQVEYTNQAYVMEGKRLGFGEVLQVIKQLEEQEDGKDNSTKKKGKAKD